MALFDFLGIGGPNEDQKKQLEAELAANMQATQTQPVSFKLPDLNDIPPAIANVASGAGQVLSTLGTQAAQSNQPTFQTDSPENIKSMEAELAAIEEQSKQYGGMFSGMTSPFDSSFDEASKKYLKPSAAPIEEQTPQAISSKDKISVRGSIGSSIPKQETKKETDLFELLSKPKEKNTAYSEALARSEEGKRLAALMSASSQIGRSIAGAGYLPDKKHDFSDVADLYGADKRTMDETLTRAAQEDAASAMDPSSNVSRAAQYEMAQIAKETGQEIKDTARLQNMSANDLKTLLVTFKNRRDDQRIREVAEENNKARAEQRALSLASLEIQRGSKKAERNQTQLNKKDKELNDFVDKAHKENTKQYAAKASFDTIAPLLRKALKDPTGVNATQQIEAIYNYISNLDQSTVREGEIKLFQGGGSHLDTLKTMMSKFGNDPRIISDRQFRDLATQIIKRGDMVTGVYDKRMTAVENSFKNRTGTELLENNPELMEKLDGVDPDYWMNKRQDKTAQETTQIPSQNTLELIKSRSDEDNKKRLQELKAKHGTK